VLATAAIPPLEHGLLVVTAVIWLLLEVRQSANRRPEGIKADRGGGFAVRFSVLVGAGLAILASRSVPGTTIGPNTVTAWIGLCILWCGIAVRLWSFQTLGRYFTFTVQTSSDQPVITSGPYRIIRHPGYAGALVAAIGIGLVIGNWLALLVLTVAVACGLVLRIRVEERALLRELGSNYQNYADTHKRLVPYIW
jgi:protein-S-isoprenylcysteine O-methyltransferase Ste14